MRFLFKPVAAAILAFLALTVQASALEITRGPYLQMVTPNEITIRWRTDLATDSVVDFGTTSTNLDEIAVDLALVTDHEVRLSGLTADTRYYYSVGSSTVSLSGDATHTFETAPPEGTEKATRVWVIGDSGTANANAGAVRDAYKNLAASETQADLWLMLGDNAYNDGTDGEYTAAVFDMYPEILRRTPLWSTLGNHDGHTADSASQSGPYYDIFTLPTAGEAGGIASGTEAYYAFDYANIHFVVLDSYETDRSVGGAMLTWLESDLEANDKEWVIAFWHHPPYTKGSHDSDTESRLIEMRENALPILEAWGVDLVLGGHSHSYERSYMVDGHYGHSSTLIEAMKLDGGDGDIDGAYTKVTGLAQPNDGAVYIVAGSSGKVTGTLQAHPVMVASLYELGSVVLDINGSVLAARFLNDQGNVTDSFTMVHAADLEAPTVISVTASAQDKVQVVFSERVEQVTAETAANYAIDQGVTVSAATLAEDRRSVTLTTSPLTAGQSYTLTVNNVMDTSFIAILPDSTASFSYVAVQTTAFQDGVVPSAGYGGTRDTYVREDNPTANFGGSATLLVDGDDSSVPEDDVASLIAWDISAIPTNAIVSDVTLVIEVSNVTSQSYEIYGLKRDWVEGETTWNLFATGQPWETGGAQGSADRETAVLGAIAAASTGSYSVSLNAAGIALVQGWVNDPLASQGFIIADSSATNGLDFRAREYGTASQRPRLEVTYTLPVAQNLNPTAAFGYLCSELNCNFIDTSTDSDGTIASWSWDFGDGNASSAQNPSHGYAAAGTYTVSLLVTDDGGATDSTSQSVTVSDAPDTTPPVISAPGPVTAEATGPLTAVAIGTATAIDDTDPNPVISHDAPAQFPIGTTTVTWTATDSSGNFATATQSVTLQDTTAPTIVLNGSASVSVVQGDPYSDAGATASDLVDGDLTAAIVTVGDSIDTSTLGVYTVIYDVADGAGNNAHAERTVTVTSVLPDFDQSMAWPLCGRISENPPAGWVEADGCPVERWGNPNFADLPINSTFGPRPLSSEGGRYDFHRGIDISTPIGTPIFASADGIVRKAGQSSGYADPLVQLRHYRPGLNSCSNVGCYHSNYMHISQAVVSVDDTVVKGQLIGYTGASASGYEHLHFEIRSAPADDVFSIWQRDTIQPLNVLPYADSSATVAVDIGFVDQSVPNNPIVPITVTTTRADIKRVEVTLYDASDTEISQPGNTADARGYNVLPSWFDVDLWNRQYTHKDSTNVPWESYGVGGVRECPYAADHGASYDANVHMDQQSPIDFHNGQFNGAHIDPPTYSSGIYEMTVTFEELQGSPNCIVATVTPINGDPAVGEWGDCSGIGGGNNNVAPVASFTASTADLTASFIDTSTDSDGTVASWSWDFGDGTTSTAQNPGHSYATAGTYTVSLTVTDDGGASNSTSQSVTVTDAPDTTPPVISAPGPVTAEATGPLTTVAIGTATASDDTDPSPVISHDAPVAFPVGLTVVTWTATDASGNSATATQDVTVVDTTPPVVTPPADVTAEATGPTTTVAIGTATAVDAVGVTSLTNNAPATYLVETKVVTWTATDTAGNIGTATQNVTLQDTTPPILTLIGDASVSVVQGNAYTDAGATASDLVDGDLTGGIVTGGLPNTDVLGVYTVTYDVSDAANNSAHAERTVTVVGSEVEVTFLSIDAEDGWILESSENSGVGGKANATSGNSKSLRAGDDRRDRQYKFILSFDTAAIPDGATILSARLQLTRGGTSGTNPFTTHGVLNVDLNKGAFGGNAALQTSDFEAAASAPQAVTIGNQGNSGALYTIDLGGALTQLNDAGRTQLRMSFSLDDNDDRGNDYAGFYSADNSNSSRHPRLIVTYQQPGS